MQSVSTFTFQSVQVSVRLRSLWTIYSCVFLRLKVNDSLANSTHHVCTFSSAFRTPFYREKNEDSDFQTINTCLFCVCAAVGGMCGCRWIYW